MPISNESMNKDLYKFLKTRGFDPIPKDSDGQTIPVPNDAEVFKFTFKQDGKDIGPAWVTIDGNQELKIYYDDKLSDLAESSSSDEFDDSWTGCLKQLKMFAKRRQLGFDTENQDHLSSDMAQRSYMKKKENISEGYYPMGKNASYNDSIPTVKIVLQHTRQIQEGEQRYRNIARIFLENAQGERILAPTTRPGIAQVYARHLAEGGVPNDDRWNHIKGLCEEYSKMAGFVRAVRGNQFNESAQRLVEAGLNHYQGLRESLGKMRGHRGYTAYFESWTPTLMENEGDETNLNELFVQETLDPRIESVMPILNRLKVNLGEMKEVDELAEWADKILESPGAETLAHNQSTEEKRLQALDLDEADDAEAAHKKSQVPAFMRKQSGDPDWKTTTQDLEKAKERNISGKEGMAALTKRLQDIGQLEEEEVEESGLQAYLGNKKYGKDGMEELQRLGREHASKEKVAKAKAKFAKEDMEEGQFAGNFETGPEGQWRNKGPKAHQPAKVGDLVGASESFINTDAQAVVSEMDSEGYKGTRDDYELGKGKEHTGTPVKAKDTAKDAEEVLNTAMDKAHKKPVKESIQLEEGVIDSIKGIVGKIKAIPGIQKFIQAAQAKKAELIQAAHQSRNGQELIKNVQAAMGGQQAVAEGWGQKLSGGLVASAGGGLMATGAELFMRAWNAMGKPDLAQMMNDPSRDGQIVLALVTMLVLVGALSLFGGGHMFKQSLEKDAQPMREGQEDLDYIKKVLGK